MGEAIPRQHPAVALRSQFKQLRALLPWRWSRVAGLSVAVVILATDEDTGTGAGSATVSAPAETPRDGGPEQGSRRGGRPQTEAVMAQTTPREQAAVVLRSRFNHPRALVAVATVVLVGLPGAVAILMTDDEVDTGGSSENPLCALTSKERHRVEALSSWSGC
jgi:hypothetical protein